MKLILRLLAALIMVLTTISLAPSPVSAADLPRCKLGMDRVAQSQSGARLKVTFKYYVSCTGIHGSLGPKGSVLKLRLHGNGSSASSTVANVRCSDDNCIPSLGEPIDNFVKLTSDPFSVFVNAGSCTKPSRYISGNLQMASLSILIDNATTDHQTPTNKAPWGYTGTRVQPPISTCHLSGSSDSAKLGRNLTNGGIYKPSMNHVAHHIVPATDTRYWTARESRRILNSFGIYRNFKVNGVWLTKTFHTKVHQNNQCYYQKVHNRLKSATSKQQVEARLARLATELKSGRICT